MSASINPSSSSLSQTSESKNSDRYELVKKEFQETYDLAFNALKGLGGWMSGYVPVGRFLKMGICARNNIKGIRADLKKGEEADLKLAASSPKKASQIWEKLARYQDTILFNHDVIRSHTIADDLSVLNAFYSHIVAGTMPGDNGDSSSKQ